MTQCPKCGGEVYNNVREKAAGTKSAKWPDFKCRDRDCGWAQWPDKKGATRAPAKAPANGGGGKWTWVSLMATYKRSLLIAEKCLTEAQARNPKAVPFTHAEVLSAAATVFIAASRDGVREVPKPAPAPEDLPDEVPDDDDDLNY